MFIIDTERLNVVAKILIVEDNQEFAELVKQWLILEHHVVDTVSDGIAGLHRLTSCKYDLVILDWILPGMCGTEICKRFRAGGGNLPILFLSCLGSPDEMNEALEAGADDFMKKPADSREVSARLRALLRRHRSI